MSRRQQQDSRLISEMKEQLKRLQERRQELESQDDGQILHQPILPHLARVMRDRQWAQVRSMVQRNMDSIDHDIQEAIGRLGSAMLEPNPICPAGRSPRQHFPDLIPCDSNQSTQRTRSSSTNILPQPGSPSRQVLLETVKEALEKRQKPVRYQEEDVCPSPRVGFYQFRHETSHDQDKLSRLSVQKLGSVTIVEPTGRDRPLNHVISVQSPSILPVRSPTRQLLSQPADTSGNEDDIKPDDVARLVSDILATQMELAMDSLGPAAGSDDSPRRYQRDNSDEFRLTIDSCTQTAIRSFKDSSTMADLAKERHQTDRGVGPDLPIWTEPDPEEIMEESLTPPRASINIVPDPTPAPLDDFNLWRRLYPPTPPSSCSESLISQVAATTFHQSLSSSSTTTGSSDAGGISSSSLATSVSSKSTVDNTSATALSWLSDGQVPNRVASPGQVTVHRPAKTRAIDETILLDRSTDMTTLSEGQIPLIEILSSTNRRQLTSTLTDGCSSEGEILLPQPTSRSDSTSSYLSATGSLGEIVQPSSSD